MTTRPVRSIIDDQLDDLVMPAGADIAAVLGLPRETLVVNLPRRMALTIKRGRKCLGCGDELLTGRLLRRRAWGSRWKSMAWWPPANRSRRLPGTLSCSQRTLDKHSIPQRIRGHAKPTRFARSLRRSGKRLFAGYVKAPVTPYRTARTILPTPPAGSAMGPGGMRHECQA